MARFNYRMQSILDIKKKLENQAKQELANAQAALYEENRKLDSLKERKEGYERKAEQLLSDTLSVREIMENKNAILRMDEYIVSQKKRVLMARENLIVAQNRMKEAMQERKIQEKLKENAFEVFLQDEKKSESKEVDELTSYTYGKEHRL